NGNPTMRGNNVVPLICPCQKDGENASDGELVTGFESAYQNIHWGFIAK
ncbi:MAG: hypothetical protein ACI9HY_002023, partial [Planctomycetaceae bacterium]